jgi:hypothetical protein
VRSQYPRIFIVRPAFKDLVEKVICTFRVPV